MRRTVYPLMFLCAATVWPVLGQAAEEPSSPEADRRQDRRAQQSPGDA